MLKKLLKLGFFLICLLEILYFFIYQNVWQKAFIEVIELWLYKVVVAIVPMYILSSLLFCTPYFSKLIFKLVKPLKLFENQKALSLLLMSFLTGNPTSSVMIKKAFLKGLISKQQAERLLSSSSHISFLFIALFFKRQLAITLIIAQIMATLILYFAKKPLNPKIIGDEKENSLDNINDIIEDLPLILLKILITMLIVTIFKLPFTQTKIPLFKIALDFLEVTTGLHNIINYHLNSHIELILISSLLSLNGGAILLQVYNIIKKTSLSFNKYFKGRMIHLILSTLLSLVIYYFF